MTAQQKSQLRIGLLTSVIGGLMLFAFTKLSGQVVLRPEFEAAQSRLEAKVEMGFAQSNARIERVLDAVCSGDHKPRTCQ